jgi:hypothetical protein
VDPPTISFLAPRFARRGITAMLEKSSVKLTSRSGAPVRLPVHQTGNEQPLKSVLLTRSLDSLLRNLADRMEEAFGTARISDGDRLAWAKNWAKKTGTDRPNGVS